MISCDELEKRFTQFASSLNSGDALNYAVSFGLYEVTGSNGLNFETILKIGLGEQASLASTHSVTKKEVLSVIREALEFAGDDGSHPNRCYLRTTKGMQDVNELINSIEMVCESAEVLAEISLKEGHPFYPVFWEYAFLLQSESKTLILIGSSSD